MIKRFLSKIFKKEKKIEKRPLTIINDNRKSTAQRRTALRIQGDERQSTCLSKYFSNIKGLNTIERNLYSKMFG
jgi:hypothetical protein